MKNIVLIGFMATGKTTVGKVLAKKLNMNFVDTDEFIEQKFNKKISEIFNESGEQLFRQYETNVVKKISTLEYCVISCGGGIVLNKINIDLLKQNGIIVCLKSSANEIFRRVSNNKNRPLLQDTSIEKIQKLLNYREQFYKNNDLEIDTDNLSIEQIVDTIIKFCKF